MKWEDEGVLLSSRNHGEHNAIIEVLTPSHGRHVGLVKYAHSPKNVNLLEPGMQLNLVWTARLNEHLGIFLIDKVKSRTFSLIKNKKTLLGFNSLISLLLLSLPEREPFQKVYEATIKLLDSICDNNAIWLASYVHWELLILSELGFGLDLSECAITGKRIDLIYVSPKTGRAVSADAGKEWEKKLLPLPKFLTSTDAINETDLQLIACGMRLTGFFLEKWLLRAIEKASLPEARNRFFMSLSN